MIDGVITKQLVTHPDERGFFREIIRATDEIFVDGFGQWSQSMMVTGTVKAWHIHQKQTDLFFVPIGAVKVVLCDLRDGWPIGTVELLKYTREYFISQQKLSFDEYLLGDNYPAQVIRIPPGVAHGLKVLQGPAHLFYITSRVYDPVDEGRIPHDTLGYDWFKQEIK